MKSKKGSSKGKPFGKRALKDLLPKKTGAVKGGAGSDDPGSPGSPGRLAANHNEVFVR